jgi:hypothetical protein
MPPVKSSTAGYRAEISAQQNRHFPRKKIQLRTGTKSRTPSVVLQAVQCEPGRMIDSSRGNRQMQTFRNEPMRRPKIKKQIAIQILYIDYYSSVDLIATIFPMIVPLIHSMLQVLPHIILYNRCSIKQLLTPIKNRQKIFSYMN